MLMRGTEFVEGVSRRRYLFAVAIIGFLLALSRDSQAQNEQPAIDAFEPISSLDGGPIFVNEAALQFAFQHRGKVALGRLPLGAGRSVVLDVEPIRVVGNQTRIVVAGPNGPETPFQYDVSQVNSLVGKVQGYADSNVALLWSPRGLIGHIDLGPTEHQFKVSSLNGIGQGVGSNLIAISSVARRTANLPDVRMCGVESASLHGLNGGVARPDGCCSEPPPSAIYNKRMKVVEIAIETDFDLYQNFNDLSAETDYIIELFARTNAIFMRDVDARFEIAFMRLFNNAAAEPPFMNDPDPLDGYVNFWDANMGAVHRDTGAFLTGRRDLPYGGIAYVGAVCTSFAYCVCGYLSGFPDPTRPNSGDYDLGVVAHELGHNFNACHTPDYCPFIDLCYPPPTVPQRGTLMSYCSQTVSGGNLMTDLWYHARLKRVMRDFLENDALCVAYDCNQNGVDDSIDLSGGTSFDVNGNGIPDECEDCNLNGVLDPMDLALGTSSDLNGNGYPDECEPDCNGNGSPDDRDIALGVSADVWGNGIPDECEADCDGNDTADYDQIQANLARDIDRNAILDSCQDCDGDGINDLDALLGSRYAWVASDVLDYVGQYHPISGVRAKISTTGRIVAAQDLIIAPGNRVLVTSATGNKVVAYDAITGAYLNDFIPAGSGGLMNPTGLVIGPNGNLFVCSQNTNSVLQYNGTTGVFLGAFVTSGSGGLAAPFGLTFGPNGDLFVTSGGNRVLEYDGCSGAFVRLFVGAANGGLSAARGMLFKPDGNLLIASYNTNAILQYNGMTGAFIGKWNSGGTASALFLQGPWGLRLGPSGNVFATRDLPATEEADSFTNPEELHVTTARIMEFDIHSGKYMRSFIVGDDTGLRSTTGFAFMPAARDCNFNMVPDNCDILSGFSADADGNGIPDECQLASVVAELAGIDKTRYISFQVPSVTTGDGTSALQVRLVSLMHPNPPNLPQFPAPNFASQEGQLRYVGAPSDCQETSMPVTTFKCASLQHAPLYLNWDAALNGQMLHVSGQAVVPSSTYEIRLVASSCKGNEAVCAQVSLPLTISTQRWGDIAGPFQVQGNVPLTQPNIQDISAAVDKFKETLAAFIVARSDVNPGIPDNVVNIADIASIVDAFKNLAYPFAGPATCP
ncbi:MAG: hypothetical protein HY287_13840 [Planctomycetes bacterium]|nr:hypothetical protein [Planctomycetota bacterium]MBI3835404.1 hypothetical protein [Planctomycetota bacterium]